MVAAEFLGYVQSFSAGTYVGFEDLADRANFQWNVIVLLICMALVTMRQYFMTPLVCYLPTTVSGVNADSYITNLCWIEGTFPINLTSGIVPHKAEAWEKMRPHQMNYYQWVPLVLGLQAILYYLPRIFWSIFTYNRTGTDLQNLVRTANSITKEEGEKRQKMVQHIARTLELLLFSRRQYRRDSDNLIGRLRHSSLVPGKRHGNNLVYVYLVVKVLYAIVGIMQLYLMYVFLRFDSREGYLFFGFRILMDIMNGKPWTETQVFPRVGMCRHTLQHVGSSNQFFAQCVLPINMLNEKIYVFLFFFLGSVVWITLISIPLWLSRMGMKKRQRHFVRRFLKIADVYDREDPKMGLVVDRFIAEFLRQDGHFILRMISMNAGDLVTVEIVCCLYADYKKQYMDKDLRGPPLVPKAPKYPHGADFGPRHGEIPIDFTDKNYGGFMSTKLGPGDVAVVRQRPLPSAPLHPPASPLIVKALRDGDHCEMYPVSQLRSAPPAIHQPDGASIESPLDQDAFIKPPPIPSSSAPLSGKIQPAEESSTTMRRPTSAVESERNPSTTKRVYHPPCDV